MLQSSETRLAYIPAVAAGSSESIHNAVEVPRSSVNTATGMFHNISNPVCPVFDFCSNNFIVASFWVHCWCWSVVVSFANFSYFFVTCSCMMLVLESSCMLLERRFFRQEPSYVCSKTRPLIIENLFPVPFSSLTLIIEWQKYIWSKNAVPLIFRGFLLHCPKKRLPFISWITLSKIDQF